MLNPSPIKIAIAIFAGLATLLLAAWLSGTNVRICGFDQSIEQNTCIVYNLASFVLLRLGEISSYYAALISALATVAIALFSWSLWKSTDRLWNAQVRHSERELRAYITVINAEIGAADSQGAMIQPAQPIAAGRRPISVIQLVNCGQTPAHDLRLFGNIDMVHWPLNPADLRSIDFSLGWPKEILGPHGTRDRFDVFPESAPVLSSPEIAALGNGTRALVVYGEVRYTDAFKQDRVTRYRYFIGGRIGLRGVKLAAHDEGNEAT